MEVSKRRNVGKCRIFVGNISGVSENQLKGLFTPFGNISDLFLNTQKGFAFLRLGTPEGAGRAVEALDSSVVNGKEIRVKRAAHNAAIWVKDLAPAVSNELLGEAFSQFGEVERAVVVCDERGLSKGYGFVEFVRKNSALAAVQECTEQPFLLTHSPRPVRVEMMRQDETEIGMESRLLSRIPNVEMELSIPPRFAQGGTPQGDFDLRWAVKWRELYEAEHRAKETLRQQIEEERAKLIQITKEAYLEEERKLREEAKRRAVRQAPSLAPHVPQHPLPLPLHPQSPHHPLPLPLPPYPTPHPHYPYPPAFYPGYPPMYLQPQPYHQH